MVEDSSCFDLVHKVVVTEALSRMVAHTSQSHINLEISTRSELTTNERVLETTYLDMLELYGGIIPAPEVDPK